MTGTLAELKRENSRLKARAKSRQEIKVIGIERAKLQKENLALRNPRLTSFKRGTKKTLIAGGKAGFGFLEKLTRPKPLKVKKVKR